MQLPDGQLFGDVLGHQRLVHDAEFFEVAFQQRMKPAVLFAPQIWNRSFSSTAYRVAWALTAGVGIQLTPSATLDINYRYLNGGTQSVLINAQNGLAIKENNVSQQIRVGVRYMLQ